MDSFGKHVFFFFFVALLISSIQIQARESKFFSKFTHYSIQNNVHKESKTSPVEAPTPAPALEPAPEPALALPPAPAPAPISTNTENGYDPFGYGSGFLPTKGTTITTTTTSPDENELLNEELDGVTYERGTSNYNNNGYTNNYNNNGDSGNYNNNGYTSNYNNNGYTGNYNYNGYKLASESYETGHENNDNGYTTNYNNNGYTSNYKNSGYETTDEQQGMSDTRFMEGGKYYVDVRRENYYPATGYESGKVSTRNQAYYGNNEFNTMEEYENQEAYEESQDEPLP